MVVGLLVACVVAWLGIVVVSRKGILAAFVGGWLAVILGSWAANMASALVWIQTTEVPDDGPYVTQILAGAFDHGCTGASCSAGSPPSLPHFSPACSTSERSHGPDAADDSRLSTAGRLSTQGRQRRHRARATDDVIGSRTAAE